MIAWLSFAFLFLVPILNEGQTTFTVFFTVIVTQTPIYTSTLEFSSRVGTIVARSKKNTETS